MQYAFSLGLRTFTTVHIKAVIKHLKNKPRFPNLSTQEADSSQRALNNLHFVAKIALKYLKKQLMYTDD
jgi:hypothetical protein